jgi:hypothetical protein
MSVHPIARGARADPLTAAREIVNKKRNVPTNSVATFISTEAW